MLAAAPAWAQSLFGPPNPPPGAAAAPRVRGLDDGRTTGAPARTADAGATPPATFRPPQDRYGLAEAAAGQSGVGPSAPTPIEGAEILARVDGQIILSSDVDWQISQYIAAAREPIPPDQLENVRQMLARRLVIGLIDAKLLYADFLRTVPEENLPNVEKTVGELFEESEVPQLRKKLGVEDRAQLEATLKRQGTSLKDVQRLYMEKTIAGTWLRERMPKPQPIAHEALLAYYHDHLKEYEYEAQATWEELMVRFDRFNGDRNAAWRALCEMGNEVWAVAQANPGLRGPAFASVARAKSHGATASEGGLHKNTTLGGLRCEELNKQLATLAIGQMSDGIASDQGFHIVRVLERKPAGRIPFTEAQADIRKLLEDEQRSALLEAEMNKLRSTARVWTAFDGDVSGPRLAELLDAGERRR